MWQSALVHWKELTWAGASLHCFELLCMTVRVKHGSPTSHVVENIRAPVATYDGGEDVIKGVSVFGGNQTVSEQPPGLIHHHLQYTVCHIRLSWGRKDPFEEDTT